ncbi:cupredoxin domain-containing protein [Ectothiorhodospiraceae bacterium 2226]|nr:cupredoxin domain-containing protein [Ectothiorhodospiraceae bacterium 2226]
MHIDPREKAWVYVSLILVAFASAVVLFTAVSANIHPPSNVETIDSASLHLSEEFAEDRLGPRITEDGRVVVTMVAARYAFYPQRVEVPANTPVTFRWATPDVLHGVHVAGTNMNTMVVPGFVSEVTTEFPRPGTYPFLCNEYCGLGHDYMWSRLVVVPQDQWQPDQVQAGPNPPGDRGQ